MRAFAESDNLVSPYALTGGPRIPWQEDDLRARIEKLKAGGITLYNMMIGGFNKTLYGKAGP